MLKAYKYEAHLEIRIHSALRGRNSWENTRLIGCRCKHSNVFSQAVLMLASLNLSIKKTIELMTFCSVFGESFSP